MKRFADFYITIDGQVGQYAIEARSAGEVSTLPIPLSFDGAAVEPLVKRLGEGGTLSRAELMELGSHLYQALFPDEIYAAYTSAQRALPRGVTLRLKLNIRAPELTHLPWELLYNRYQPAFLAFKHSQPIVRTLDSLVPTESFERKRPLRILQVQAQPRGTATLALEESEAILRDVWGTEAHIETIAQTTPADLRRRLYQRPGFHVLHYDGHATFNEQEQTGYLILEDNQGTEHPLSAEELVDYLDSTEIRLVVLNACQTSQGSSQVLFTGLAHHLMHASHVPAIVAMQYLIADESALAFIEGFYTALAAGEPVDAAVAAGRLAIREEQGYSDATQWAAPVLFMRTQEGELFAPEEEKERPQRPPYRLAPAQERIGHEDKLRELYARYEQVREQGRGQIVFLTGRHGMGRRALAQEVAEYARSAGGAVLIARFWPPGSLDTEEEGRAYLSDPQLGPALEIWGDEVARHWPKAVRLAGWGWQVLIAQAAQYLDQVPGPAARSNAFGDDPRAWRSVLRELGRRGPVLLIIEELSDAPSLWIDLLRNMTGEIVGELAVLCLVTQSMRQPLPEQSSAEIKEEAVHLIHTLRKAKQAVALWLGPVGTSNVARYLGLADPKLVDRLHHLSEGITVLIESLWEQWIAAGAVTQDSQGVWQSDRLRDVWVFGEAHDQAEVRLDHLLPPEAPFERKEVEDMLAWAAVEGEVFTAQIIARILDIDLDDLMDFWDEYLLEDEQGEGLLQDNGFVPMVRGGVQIYLNRYRFVQPYLREVWLSYRPQEKLELQRHLVGIVEILYEGYTDQVLDLLIELFEATNQEGRAEPYRKRRQFHAEVEVLQWQILLLEQVAHDPFDLYRLFELHMALAEKLYESGQWQGSHHEASAALRLAAQLGDILCEGRACNVIGLGLHQDRQDQAARPYLERALYIFESHIGSNHPITATCHDNLALSLQAMGNYAAAQPHHERALAIREEVLGLQHPRTALSLNNLGSLLINIGGYAAALPYYQRALTIFEQVWGPLHIETATSLDNLGYLFRVLGDYAAARIHHERALALFEQLLGPQHPAITTSLSNLGTLLETMGDYSAARPYYERAFSIREATLGPTHPSTATMINNLGTLLAKQGEYIAARPYYERTLMIFEQTLGPLHPETAVSLCNLGGLLEMMGDYAAAFPYYQRALTIQETVLGPKHPSTQITLFTLAMLIDKLFGGAKQQE